MSAARSSTTVLSLLLVVASQSGCPVGEETGEAVFDRTKLHKIAITVDEAHLEQLATDLEARVPCTLSYDGEVVSDVGIRQKGNKLVELEDKPSFSVKIDEFDEQAELHGIKKLLLNNAKQDSAFLREQIGGDLHDRAGVPAPRTAHAVVTLNGVDKGIYVVTEAVDKRFLRRHFGEVNDEGALYEGPCCGDFVDDIGAAELDGGEDKGAAALRALADAIRDTPDEQLAAKLSEHLDLDRFITSFALETLLGHWDGYAYRANNYYIYKNPADGRFVFMPHGMDRILDDPYFDTETAPVAVLPRRIREIPALDERFRAELDRIASSAWDEPATLAAIDQAAQVIGTASAGEATRDDLAEFTEHASALRDDLKLRRTLIDPAIACGDGNVGGLETCDDGNTAAGDGCSAACRVEP
ncbi:CotH kinase family protein [Sorangium sp. So ce1078]|uniref:CotH kinase family protein n=1 Tax=Sorangium sp. So ce1078 TaxID=3133329 RepID=UPI003F647283